ncbi:phosphotransferase [Luteibacter sp. 9135]|uniref:phosphotransferase n=1 Tax=Luteibacter sp. 9135 TaxID=1500893 RepID=UPI0006921843
MDGVTEGALRQMLQRAWGWGEVRLVPLTGGHTNRSFLVHGDAPPCVARLSWAGKTATQVDREARMLALATEGLHTIAVPTIIPTLHGAGHVTTAAGQWLHVFERIEGTTGVPVGVPGASADAMRGLATLHAALARAATDTGDPVAWLLTRYRRVYSRGMPTFMHGLVREREYDAVLTHAGDCLARASTSSWASRRIQWLHGDFHAGNLLFHGARLRGVVDFDEVGQGSAWLEAAFAAFALSRDVTREDAFCFDTIAWGQSMCNYACSGSVGDVATWIARRDVLATLFCVDQVLIHLEAAQRGLWIPGPGMGFLGGWQTLLQLAQASPASAAGDASQRRTASTVASLVSAQGDPSCRQTTASSPAAD